MADARRILWEEAAGAAILLQDLDESESENESGGEGDTEDGTAPSRGDSERRASRRNLEACGVLQENRRVGRWWGTVDKSTSIVPVGEPLPGLIEALPADARQLVIDAAGCGEVGELSSTEQPRMSDDPHATQEVDSAASAPGSSASASSISGSSASSSHCEPA